MKGIAIRPSRRVLRWLLVVFLLAGCALLIDLGEALEILRRVPPVWIAGILALWTFDRILMAWKWSFLLRGVGVDLPLTTLTRLYYQGTFSGTFLPSSVGGDILRAYWVSKTSGATHEVYAAVVMEKMIGVLSAANWAFAGAALFIVVAAADADASWIAVVVGGTLLVNGLFLFSLQPCCFGLVQRGLSCIPSSRVLKFFDSVWAAYGRFGSTHRAVAWNVVLTVVEHGLQILIVFAMATSLGIRAETLPFVAVTAVYLFIYRLPLAPDGWGVGEVTAIGLFGLIGVPPESGFALALLSHVLQTIVILPGLWFLWRSGSTVPALRSTEAGQTVPG
jgi:uncharacterized protein (TIRG00374 family)